MWFRLKPRLRKNRNYYLTKIPFFGYFFRKIKENQQTIETTLKTGKETKSEIKQRYFLSIFKIVSSKTFNLLKMPVKAKIEKGKLKAKVKYPLVGGAELELGTANKLKTLVKVPFLFKAKLSGLLKLKKKNEKR